MSFGADAEVCGTEGSAHLECTRRTGIHDAPVGGVPSHGEVHKLLHGSQDLKVCIEGNGELLPQLTPVRNLRMNIIIV